MKKEKKKKSFVARLFLTLILGILCGVLIFLAPAGIRKISELRNPGTEEQKEEPKKKNAEQKEGGQDLSADMKGIVGVATQSDLSAVWESVLPSVVEITSTQVETYQFFGREYEEESVGKGSGVIVAQADSLLVLTNCHVVDGASEIWVGFFNGTASKATLLGSNAQEDIAVLGVKYSNMDEETLSKIKLAAIGSSQNLKCGEKVVAIGNAIGEGTSLSAGCVSAMDREITIDNKKMHLIQTDAAINPGNSGGPLLNMRGEVVGINNAKYASTEVEGVGYAIPIDNALRIVNQLINREKLEFEDSADLGIVCQDVIESLASSLNIPVGIYITDFEEVSAARDAGIPPYSVITQVNGITVKNTEQLFEELLYIRGGSKGTVTVMIKERGEYVPHEYEVVFGKPAKTVKKEHGRNFYD